MMVWLVVGAPLHWPWTMLLLLTAAVLGTGCWAVTRWHDTRAQARTFNKQVAGLMARTR